MVGHFDLPVGEGVDLVFAKITVIEVGLLVEKGSLDLCAGAVNEFDVKKAAMATLVLPSLLLVFFCYAGFDFPVKKERV